MLSAFLSLEDRLPKSWPELQMRIMQLARESSPPPGLRLFQAELSRESNQLSRARIRRFESDMPSQAIGLQCVLSGHPECAGAYAASQAIDGFPQRSANFANHIAKH
jgi:hypothetical protein